MLNTALKLNNIESYDNNLHNNIDFNYFNHNLLYENLASNLYLNASNYNYLNIERPLTDIKQEPKYANSLMSKNENLSVAPNLKQEESVYACQETTRQVFHCEFCNKITQRNHFKGRFCSKICIGRFAVKYVKNFIISKSDIFKKNEFQVNGLNSSGFALI